MDQTVLLPQTDPQFMMEVEHPLSDAVLLMHERLTGFGWVLTHFRVTGISVWLDGVHISDAMTGLSRPDIAELYQTHSGAGKSGFAFSVFLPARPAGPAELSFVIKTTGGEFTQSLPVLLGAPAKAAAPAPEASAVEEILVPPVAAWEPPEGWEPEPTIVAVSIGGLPPAMHGSMDEAFISPDGILHVVGWVVSLARIETVEVFLDEGPLGAAQMWLAREDVGRDHPDYPDSALAGYAFHQALSAEQLACRMVRVRVNALGGITRDMTRLVTAPERVKRKKSDGQVRYFCDTATLAEDGAIVLSGWSFCPSGVAEISVELDGEHVGLCDSGRERPDVGNTFPEFPAARHSGFKFFGNLGRSITGEHIFRLTVRGREDEEREILIPVAAASVENGPVGGVGAEGLRFYLDSPGITEGVATEPVRGFLSLVGWAIAPTGVTGVEVFVDGSSLGQAYYGIRREDIGAAFPEWEGSLLCGYAMLVPPPALRKGRHAIRLVATAKSGEVSEVAFELDAEPATETPGPWTLRTKLTQAETDLMFAIIDAKGYRPEHELLLCLDDQRPEHIAGVRQTIRYLVPQAYADWHLTILVRPEADIVSLAMAIFEGFQSALGRIDIVSREPDVLLADLASADWPCLVGLLAPGDLLGEDALIEMAVETVVRDLPDFLYSDDRRIDPSDGEGKAFFKPDWSPDLLLSTNYIGHLWLATPQLLRAAGVTFGDLRSYGEYDLVLRLTECADKIMHLPKMICQRTASVAAEPPEMELLALERAMQRRGIAGRVEPGCIPGTWRLRRDVMVKGMVSIIIPTVATRGLIKITIDSIRQKSTYRNFEIICLDNIPEENEWWKNWLRENSDEIVEIKESFNWSRFNNKGAERARGEFLLFLNDDIEVLEGDWLEGLLEHAQRPEVGVVGPQLLYPDMKVQHAGMFLAKTVARHAFRFSPRDEPGPFGLALTQRNVIAVTGACFLVRRDAYDALDGFDEQHAVINNDLDYCLRSRRAGLRVIYTPHVTLIHHEMVSRAKIRDIYNAERFAAAWSDLFQGGDPYFSPHLTSDYDEYMAETEPVRTFQVGYPLIAKDRVRRILVVKLDHIGDFIAALPAFRRIKHHFPDAELTVLAARASQSLAALEPAIDRMLEFNFFNARSELGLNEVTEADLLALQDRLEPYHFDIAIDLRRQSDTRKVLRYTGARWLAGFEQSFKMPWLDVAFEFEGDHSRTNKRIHVTNSLQRLVDATAQACESERDTVRNFLSQTQARQAISHIPAVIDIGAALFARRLVCVHVGAGAENKQWPPASFGGLVNMLVSNDDVNVVVVGGPDEIEIVAEMLVHVKEPDRVFSLVGKTSLRDLPKILRACDLYIGNDSGPKHMAASVGVPTVGIHSGSVDAGEWGPLGPLTMTIRRDMTCSPCYIAFASDCPRGLICLKDIRVGDVYRACKRMLVMSTKLADEPAVG